VTDLYGRTLHPATGEAPIFMREYGRRNPLSNAPPESPAPLPASGITYAGQNTFLDSVDEGKYLVKTDSVLTMPMGDSSPQFSKQTSCFADIPETCFEDETVVDESDKHPCRARSVIGTVGFMAPEIAVMLAQDDCEHAGYTKAVDWWSLGCTMYKLITGKHPFTVDADPNMDDALEGTLLQQYNAATKYAVLFEDVDYSHPEIAGNPEAKSFMSKLLTVDEAQRLGYGPKGSAEIKAHPFFSTIDWALLEKAKLTPPYFPPLPEQDPMTAVYGSLAECVHEVGKPNWMKPRKSDHLQRYFSTWNYTSAAAIVAEFDYMKSIMPDAADELSVR
jgi:serine/threonine protein kinase